MRYLLDVNVLLAWGWPDHAEHHRVASWIGRTPARRDISLLTSAIPELGFVRVSVQRTGGRISVASASETLAGMLASLGRKHEFISDGVSSAALWPNWCNTATRTTDAHLLVLAANNDAQLLTLDMGIPGATLLAAA